MRRTRATAAMILTKFARYYRFRRVNDVPLLLNTAEWRVYASEWTMCRYYSTRPSDGYMHQQTWPSLFQIKACCLFGVSHIPGDRFKNSYEFLNKRALKMSTLCKNRFFNGVCKIYCVEFQMQVCILFRYENLRALRLVSWAFFKRSPETMQTCLWLGLWEQISVKF